jgi:general stress protein 26
MKVTVTDNSKLEQIIRVQKLWHSEMASWFPAGLKEPDLALLRIDVQHAEAWDCDNL